MEQNRFLDLKSVCKYTSLSKSYIYKKVMHKTIPFIKVGSKTIFDREQIDVWMLNGGRMSSDIPEFPKFLN
jgi:excisionase family DNA binding protein